MKSLVPRLRKPWLAAAVLIATLAAAAGVLAAVLAGPASEWLPGGQAATALGPNGEPQIVPADPAVEFPKALRDLPNPPSALAVDPKTGDLWFLLFTYDGASNILYHYSPAAAKVETFAIPSGGGTELYYTIAIDERGHVILAEGSVVIDFDPAASAISRIPVGGPEAPRATYFPGEPAQIADMALGSDDTVYLSRMNVPAITELHLLSGATRELPYPLSFGPALDIELAGGILWLTSRWSLEGVSEAQTWTMDPATGIVAAVGTPTTALAAAADGRLLGIRAAQPGLAGDVGWVRETGFEPLSFASDGDRLAATAGVGLWDHVAASEDGTVLWVAEGASGRIARIDTQRGVVQTYQLPVYETQGPWNCWPNEPCEAAEPMTTAVRGLAVAPDGDLYFSDATLNRIGVIHAGP